ncbi:MAG TPA: potassium-transporting ATPase subunit KdpC [Baekduia sp.]|uniref:potassium-transporting ATPase subunit KdpC n=1 Tax=Baekduia sp. TaxID=2600305 RepID=UPI002D777F52|nr:potassium-transporting ATPase subunit KdpC [Baekduia sp.]HET6506132.1 potassium-transporting ATPase subunit KdpC [Baekduia sp.]
MRKDLIRGSLAVIVFTVLFGLAYPLVMTGVAQVAFPHKANGSLVKRDGKVVGSTLLGQAWKGDQYFQPRPSATDYSADVTAFGNHGPNQRSTADLTRDNIEAYIKREGPYDPGLTAAKVPVDAATFSASGVDPDISKANAAIQERRVAAVRHLPLARVRQLVAKNTDGRGLGIFGEPGVNVTTLNLALDQVTAR